MNFAKPPLSIEQQLEKWRSRGMVISNAASAEHYLRFIGYYRFSGYSYPFQDLTSSDKTFKTGVSFEQILSVYIFDRELRVLVMDAIERIEVAVRATMVNQMSMKYGPHWFMDPGMFTSSFKHADLLNHIDEELGIPADAAEKSPSRAHNEVFINHYYSKYTSPYLPPCWMVFEILSLGKISKVFANLKKNFDRNAIAMQFKVDEQVLKDWIHCLSYVRNLCAHHARLWNRKLVIKATIAKMHSAIVNDKEKFYAVAVILRYLLSIIAPDATWHHRLKKLVADNPEVPITWMGFPKDWEKDPFWI